MRIAVCIKQVFDVFAPLQITEECKNLESQRLPRIMNPADRSSLMIALEIKRLAGGEVTAITIGDINCERMLRDAVSQGADKAVRIWNSSLEGKILDAHMKGQLLSEALAGNYDLIVCGNKSLDTASGLVGATISEHLGCCYVPSVVSLKPENGGLVAHRKLLHGAREIVSFDCPAVVTVDTLDEEAPCVPLESAIAAQRFALPVMDPKDFSKLNVSRIQENAFFGGYIPPKPRTKKASRGAGVSAAQRMKMMMGGGPKKGGDVIEGSPEDAAKALIDAVRERSK